MSSGKRSSGGHGRKPNGVDESAIEAQLSDAERWWRSTNRYGYSGVQGMLINPQVFNPDFLPGYTWNQLGWFFQVTYTCIDWKSWEVLITEPFMLAGLEGRGNDSSGSHKRYKNKWEEAGFLKCVRHGGKKGNWYLVAPLLTVPYIARELAHFHQANALLVHAKEKLKRELAAAEKERHRLEEEKKRQTIEWRDAASEAKKKGLSTPKLPQFQVP